MKNIHKYIIAFACLGTMSTLLGSCVKNQPTINKLGDIRKDDIQTYADLFKVFWNGMNDRYAYFYEQNVKTGKDWQQIYDEYYPKFAALKYYRDENLAATDKEIVDNAAKAKEYFTEIMGPIIDRHFSVGIGIPVDRKKGVLYSFYGGMKQAAANRESGDIFLQYGATSKMEYMRRRLAEDSQVKLYKIFTQTGGSVEIGIAGRLISNPDIYYMTYQEFFLVVGNRILLNDNGYLTPDGTNTKALLTLDEVENSPLLAAISDPDIRAEAKKNAIDFFNTWEAFCKDPNVKLLNEEVKKFNSTEVVTEDLVRLAEDLRTKRDALVEPRRIMDSDFVNDENEAYFKWFSDRMITYEEDGYNVLAFDDDIKSIPGLAPFYRRLLNPLHEGKIKKLIVDLRSNGGGAVADLRFFVDRLIHDRKVFSYQRLKEGNTRYDYTPWMPVHTQIHPFGAPNKVQMAILLDRESMSMSEISTLSWKSQGDHVITVGENSAGATAGLGEVGRYNAGSQDNIGGLVKFYMPLMATKDYNNNLIEGVGITPDIPVSQPTAAEVSDMSNNPDTHVDRVFAAAVKALAEK